MFYKIVPENPEAHLFLVSCRISKPDPKGQIVSLPAWIPGSYMIREFAKNIVTLTATSNGQPVALKKIDKSSWQLEPCKNELALEYKVYAWDLSVRSAHLDITHGYFNGASVFLQVHGQEEQPCTVEILAPSSRVQGTWRVATSLARDSAELYGFGVYRAANYDDLIDHPVEMADFNLASFEAAGVPHDIVVTGRHRADLDRLSKDLKQICETHIEMFGELPKMDRYLFLVWVIGDGYGGLEHRASCSLLCSRKNLPVKGREEVTEDYRSFLGLCSHEYFHTWNVKQIKPEGFMPYRLASETYTRQLWAFEGITSYYDDLGLVHSGLITVEEYLQTLAQTITKVWRGKGRFKQSVADSSFDAWTKFYRQDENAPNAIVSYYTKGSLIALALDFTIRKATNDEKSLNDLMHNLWLNFGKPGKGVPEGEIERLASEMAGQDLSPFFNQFLYGTEDLPLADLLAQVGVEFCLRPAESADDKGGSKSKKTDDVLARRPDLGVRLVTAEGGLKIANAFSGGAAEKAGLAAGDVLIALDGLRLDQSKLAQLLAPYGVGDEVIIHAFRRDELMQFKLTLQSPPLDTVELVLLSDIDQGTLERRNSWLRLN